MTDNQAGELLPCPFCGDFPRREVKNDILMIECQSCVSVGFHNHIRFGCRADQEWNTRASLQSVAQDVPEADCGDMVQDRMTPEQEREAFERSFVEHCKPLATADLKRLQNGGYNSTHTQDMWDIWQARAALQQPTIKPILTPEMLEAGAEYLYGHTREEATEWAKLDKFESEMARAEGLFNAMLNAALTPEVK